jgi:hypothetical protein
MLRCSNCSTEHLVSELTDFQAEKLCANCLAEKKTSVFNLLKRPLGIATITAAVVPFLFHLSSGSSSSVNGVVVAWPSARVG